MGSDRARVSFDPKQQYRSVIMQQGRVTLEADWNESQQIASEAMRHETLDIVGPAGTPDDGYKIVVQAPGSSSPFDFQITQGTMYVGGIRTVLEQPVLYSNQPDWKDTGPEDPDWVSPAMLAKKPPVDEFVYLFLREQEISAVEDPDLKDVALGGPDTAQRGRLLQRIVRLASTGTDCASGLSAAQKHWGSEGLVFDASTMRLTSTSTLAVSAADQTPTANPCQPQAQGGYVDPDNQLIRVQISGVDPLTGNPTFLWGFDDASFLYRIDIDPNNPQNIVFESSPVDSFRQPVNGQTVEILRTAAELPNGASVAALSGFPFTLDQNYDPDSQSILLPSGVTLPSDYLAATQTPPLPLFLRVWQQQKVFTAGVPTVLGDTGLQVTLETAQGEPFHVGDYWMFAVRPATPQTVYPERYWNSFQPPEGPRMWACPLAILAWKGRSGVVASDCRNFFDNLTSLGKRQNGCCTINLKPQDLSATRTLQSVIDGYSNLAMTVTANVGGFEGNNIAVEISNSRPDLSPATFDFSVMETVSFQGLTVSAVGPKVGLEVSNSPYPAHVLRASISQAENEVPRAQTVRFSNTKSTNARANILDAKGGLVFTLEARGAGDAGNFTTATVSGIDTTVTPNTFNLTLSWKRTLPGLIAANAIQSIQAGMQYAINVTGPTMGKSVLPAEGVISLTGGGLNANGAPIYAAGVLYGGPVTVCLAPGVYNLPQPLSVTNAVSNLTIEACGGGATLAAATNQPGQFQRGLISMTGTKNLTLRGLTFKLPTAVVSDPTTRIATSVGLRPVDCHALTVEKCVFTYPHATAISQLQAGIFAGGNMAALRLRSNRFDGVQDYAQSFLTTGNVVVLSIGYYQGPATTLATSVDIQSAVIVPTFLDDCQIVDNSFRNLYAAITCEALTGTMRIEGNIVRSSLFGIGLSPTAGVTSDARASAIQANADTLNISAVTAAVQNPTSLEKSVAANAAVPVSNLASSTVAATAPTTAAQQVSQEASSLAPAATAPPPAQTTLTLNLHIANNDIDAILTYSNHGDGGSVVGSYEAVNISGVSGRTDEMLMMTNNRFRSQSSTYATVTISNVSRCVVANNLILNEATAVPVAGAVVLPKSLSMANIDQVTSEFLGKPVFAATITGNVLHGQPILPYRGSYLPGGLAALVAPMDHWEAYNTEI